MGAAYPELVRAQPLITETLKLEETRFKQTLERGLRCSTRRRGRLGKAAAAARRGRLQALRHLRLPARPDAGRAARPRPHGRHRRLRRGDGARSAPRRARAGPAPARRRPRRIWFELREQLGATEFLGYDDRDRRRQGRRADRRRQARSTRPTAGDRRLGHRQPDAVLRRVRRPDRRQPASCSPPTGARVRGARHAEEARRPVRASRHGRSSGTLKVGDVGRAARSTARAAPRSAPTIRRRICCTRRCAVGSAST